MASTGNLVSIKMIADRLMRNPLMKDLSYEFIVDNAIQVLRILDAPSIYAKKRERINVVNLRALKPLDMIRIESITRVDTGVPIALTASEDVSQEFFHEGGGTPTRKDLTYTLNSKYISVNFESGKIDIIYKAVA